jgi:hypothetical protein
VAAQVALAMLVKETKMVAHEQMSGTKRRHISGSLNIAIASVERCYQIGANSTPG